MSQPLMNQQPEVIFFDLYETLITEYRPNYTPPPQTIAQRLGVEETAFRQCWKAHRPAYRTGHYADFPTVLRAMCAELGVSADETLLAQLTAERIADKAMGFKHVKPAVYDMLAQLNRLPIKLCLLSNAALEDGAAWFGSQLEAYFDETIFSYQVGLLKPDVTLYQLACERMGVAPAKAWHVDDSGSNDLPGAAAAGLRPLWATWYLNGWPSSRRARPNAIRASQYEEVATPSALLERLH